MDEKRRYHRIPLDCPITLYGGDGRTYQGEVLDISMGGVLVDFRGGARPVEIKSFLIELTEGNPAFTLEGDARIVRESPEGFLGLYFLKTDQDSLTHLQRLIDLNLRDPDAEESEIDKW